jgi:hypothetical protein
MSHSFREFVRVRAGRRCEYCHLPESAAVAAVFHVEHIISRQHGGVDSEENRCWSCHRCNFHKGPNLSGRDGLTGNIVRLFDPRRQLWRRHFKWQGAVLVGRTQIGRATIAVLNINDPQRVELRRLVLGSGEWTED